MFIKNYTNSDDYVSTSENNLNCMMFKVVADIRGISFSLIDNIPREREFLGPDKTLLSPNNQSLLNRLLQFARSQKVSGFKFRDIITSPPAVAVELFNASDLFSNQGQSIPQVVPVESSDFIPSFIQPVIEPIIEPIIEPVINASSSFTSNIVSNLTSIYKSKSFPGFDFIRGFRSLNPNSEPVSVEEVIFNQLDKIPMSTSEEGNIMQCLNDPDSKYLEFLDTDVLLRTSDFNDAFFLNNPIHSGLFDLLSDHNHPIFIDKITSIAYFFS